MTIVEKQNDYILYWRADTGVLEMTFADARNRAYHIGANSRLPGLEAKEWHHFAVTSVNPVGNKTAKFHFYLDGVKQPVTLNVNASSVGAGWFTGDTGVLHIGSRSSSNTAQLPFSGLINKMKILNRVLTPAEIVNIYKAGNDGK